MDYSWNLYEKDMAVLQCVVRKLTEVQANWEAENSTKLTFGTLAVSTIYLICEVRNETKM